MRLLSRSHNQRTMDLCMGKSPKADSLGSRDARQLEFSAIRRQVRRCPTQKFRLRLLDGFHTVLLHMLEVATAIVSHWCRRGGVPR
jgi:hypothetical protein